MLDAFFGKRARFSSAFLEAFLIGRHSLKHS